MGPLTFTILPSDMVNLFKVLAKFQVWAQCHKTFYARNFQLFVKNSCFCPWQAFTAYYNIGW
jgi:hypothetical protein